MRLTGFILKATLLIELAGALFMLPVFGKDFGLTRGLWYSLFHSISAFCNAGFDLMGSRGEFSSLTAYAGDGLICGVILVLIVTGGIGFLTWDDIRWKGIHFKKYRMQSKAILLMTFLLILFPSLIFFFGEFQRPVFGDMPVGLTLGITPELGGISRLILIGLMFFGRVGGLTLVFAAFSDKAGTMARLPKEKITVG